MKQDLELNLVSAMRKKCVKGHKFYADCLIIQRHQTLYECVCKVSFLNNAPLHCQPSDATLIKFLAKLYHRKYIPLKEYLGLEQRSISFCSKI